MRETSVDPRLNFQPFTPVSGKRYLPQFVSTQMARLAEIGGIAFARTAGRDHRYGLANEATRRPYETLIDRQLDRSIAPDLGLQSTREQH